MDNQYLVFILDNQGYALHLSKVDSIARMVNIIPLPGAPSVVLGVVNMRGRVIPVVNIRQLFKLPQRDALLTDQLIFANTERRPVALMADAVTGIIEGLEHRLVSTDIILPGIKYLDGVIKLEDGLVFIHNLGELLSLDEEQTLNLALGTT